MTQIDDQLAVDVLTLAALKRKKEVSSSYFFHQLFISIGIFMSIEDLLLRLESNSLLRHDGYFDTTSGLLKNISITDEGIDFVDKNDLTVVARMLTERYGDNELIDRIILS